MLALVEFKSRHALRVPVSEFKLASTFRSERFKVQGQGQLGHDTNNLKQIGVPADEN